MDIVVGAKMGRAAARDNGLGGWKATKESIPVNEALNNLRKR